MSGRVHAVVGPSGAGKDTLLAGLAGVPGIHVARRVITRPAQPGGEPYTPASEAAFAQRLAAGEFALHWRAHGLRYGVPQAEFAPLDRGCDVVFNGSRGVLARAAQVFEGLQVILITAPRAILAARLAARGREDASAIAARLARETEALLHGLPVTRIMNDTTPQAGIAALIRALQPNSARCSR